MTLIVDGLIVIGLLMLATRILSSRRDLLHSVLLFIAFSFAMMLVWIRLDVPDLALAEAAVGGVIASVLLFDTLGRLRRHTGDAEGGGRDSGG